MEEIKSRCEQIASAKFAGHEIPKNFVPTGFELTAGVKILVINSFLTVLAYCGDLTETEFRELLIVYRKKLEI